MRARRKYGGRERKRPRVSDCVLHAIIPTQRHATVTVGPGDEAEISLYFLPSPSHTSQCWLWGTTSHTQLKTLYRTNIGRWGKGEGQWG